MESYQFQGYTLRPATVRDLKLACEWTAADPDHAGRVDPWFWIESRANCFLLFDSEGPIFFFKGIREANIFGIHVQFPPYDRPEMRHRLRQRISQGLIEGLMWLEEQLCESPSPIQLIFESETPALIRFCERRLGFKMEAGKLTKHIATRTLSRVVSGQPAHTGD